MTAIVLLSGSPQEASAQEWPNRGVRIVVGQTPGAPSDLIARTIAESLSELWQQPVVVENRIGAGGTIAADLVAKAPADGYTLLIGSHSNLAWATLVYPRLRYDPQKDFAPIGRVARVPYFLAVNSEVPVKSIAELVAAARARPGRLTFISIGAGTANGLVLRLLMARTGIELVEVPYTGLALAVADLLAGRVDLGVASFDLLSQHVAAGKLRFLAVTGASRAPRAPDVPTISEQGPAGVVVYGWYGLAAPAGVPADVRARLREALDRVLRTPEVRRRMEKLDYQPIFDDPAQFAAAIRSEIEMYSQAIRPAGSPAGQ